MMDGRMIKQGGEMVQAIEVKCHGFRAVVEPNGKGVRTVYGQRTPSAAVQRGFLWQTFKRQVRGAEKGIQRQLRRKPSGWELLQAVGR